MFSYHARFNSFNRGKKGFTPLDSKPRGIINIQRGKHLTGFTIIEVIVAALIVAILSAGVFSAFVGAQRLLIKARYRVQAYNFEKEVLDKLRSDSQCQWTDDNMREDLPHKASDIGVNVSGELSRLLFNANPDTDFTYNVQGNETAPYKTVTVTLKLDWSKLEE